MKQHEARDRVAGGEPTPPVRSWPERQQVERAAGPVIAATSTYGVGTTIALDYDHAVARVKEALAAEGFGILCEIDVAATMKKKLDVDFRPYVILGACNPALALRALTAERDVGLLLPCNVIVYADDTPGHSVVAAMDPAVALDVIGNAAIRSLAVDVKLRLTGALAAVERSAPLDRETS